MPNYKDYIHVGKAVYFSKDAAKAASAELNQTPVLAGEAYAVSRCWPDKDAFCVLRLYGADKKLNGLFRNAEEVSVVRDGLLKQTAPASTW